VFDYQFQWGVLARYQEALWSALATSLGLALISMVFGSIGGLALAYAAVSHNRWIRLVAKTVIDTTRNTPLLLLVFIVFFALPQAGTLFLDRYQSFVLALSIVASGYLAENFRASLATLPKTYLDGARAVGLRAHQRQLYVVLPIVVRQALPSMTNSYISIFKDTSVASIVAIHELTFVAREINTNTFRIFEAWLAVGAVYIFTCAVLAGTFAYVERRFPKVA
jgi:His/Glu/Gln/Arg/opine family amino acid ABC transporter permease subunit